MGKRISPTLVGTFVLGAITLAVAAVIVLGSGRIFLRPHLFALYFSSDVNGLKVGAPVKFRGVEIGSVASILLSVGTPSQSRDAENVGDQYRIPVVIDLETEKLVKRGAAVNLDDPATVAQAIKRGLRGQLNVESLVTGLLYVDLDYRPDTPAKFYMGADSPYPEIPTVPTKLEQAATMLSKMLEQLEKIQFDEVIKSLTNTAVAITTLANSPKIQNAVDSLNLAARSLGQASASVNRLAAGLDREIGPMGTDLRLTTEQTRATLKQTQDTLAAVQMTLGPNAPLNYELAQTLEQTSAAARSLRELSDYLRRNPSSVVRGRYTSDQGN
ncbi:MAG TPA: MlaD family protein [Candidatus Binataceae bacterium]|jgi:paraquat-inducible protein B|nr:MlaD family protein [Candidatus Binataceae bacterium]